MAKIVDILKLQHEHPERLQYAEDGMRDFGYKTWHLQLLKELDDSYVYKIIDAVSEEDEYDDIEEDEDNGDDNEGNEVETYGCEKSEAIVADSKGNIYFTSVLTYDGNHFTKEEIRWIRKLWSLLPTASASFHMSCTCRRKKSMAV